MNEGSPMMYHGSGGFGGPGVYMMGQMDRGAQRHYPVEYVQVSGRSRGGSPAGARHGAPRRPKRENTGMVQRQPASKRDNTAFGYDSDDSSQSSSASGSGSNKSDEKGENGTRPRDRPTGSSNRGGAWSGTGTGGGTGTGSWGTWTPGTWGQREWRPRVRRDTRPRRIAPDRYLNASYPFQVKFMPEDLTTGSKWDNLSQEIWNKFVKSQQTEETFRNKMNLWRYLYIAIESLFPRYGLYVVGSTMSGFGLESSDMDLCLYVRPLDSLEPRAHALLHLNYVLGYIKSLDPNAELIMAKVPILKFRDAHKGLQVDLNCNNVVGIKNTNLLYCYSRQDWRVRPLVCAAKLWAQAHDINDARHSSLSSYSLTLMVIHFLQCGTSPAVLRRPDASAESPHARNRTSLGELFLQLLKYYAEFPYDKMAVSVRAGQPLLVAECRAARSPKNDPHQWKLLCVEEPFDLTNTARSVYDPDTFEKIVATFRESYRRLATKLRLSDAFPLAATER